MQDYHFSCPIAGCSMKIDATAASEEEAIDMLSAAAREHLNHTHPDVQKTDEQVKSDISTMMTTS